MQFNGNKPISLTNPFAPEPPPAQPLRKYAIPNLGSFEYQSSPLVLGEKINSQPTYESFTFTYQTLGKTMSGVINLPSSYSLSASSSGSLTPRTAAAVLMIRGYVPLEIYTPGVGTKNVADILAQRGFITIAPDFFGYGSSDPEFADPWEERFSKPVSMMELITAIEQFGIPTPIAAQIMVPQGKLGIWAHSNGGQIALATLEGLGRSIPTALWAPVTAPFPYSILFFGDEQDDEGKSQRAWIALFEKTYDVFEFSVTKHLNRLQGPLQIHHGTQDDAALYAWSTEFTKKLKIENQRREDALKSDQSGAKAKSATAGAMLSELDETASTPAAQIDYQLYTYPGADHNLLPKDNWNLAVMRDVEYFTGWLISR